MDEAISAMMNTVAESSLVIPAHLLITKYKADRVTIADSLASDLTFSSLFFTI
jgi:hypothetical protein